MIPELRDILFIDIETVAATDDYSSLDERLKVQWSRRAGFYRRDSGLTDEELFHERAGIHAEFGKIICIAVGRYMLQESGEMALKTKVYSSHFKSNLKSSNDKCGTGLMCISLDISCRYMHFWQSVNIYMYA